MRIIDFHTHAFPDAVAEKAIPFLEAEAHTKAFHDGKITSLVESMDRAGIEKSVICSIATKPQQFRPILEWSQAIASPRLIPFASLHPDDPDIVKNVELIQQAGLKGIKMHPYYQRYLFDEQRMIPFYEAIARCGLVFICHTGFDIAFPRNRIADPARIASVLKAVPGLPLVATHLGAWEDWDEVERLLIGREIYLEISYTTGILPDDKIKALLFKHPSDYLLFGTDSPWDDQKRALEHFISLNLDDGLKEKMLYTNAARLLGLSD